MHTFICLFFKTKKLLLMLDSSSNFRIFTIVHVKKRNSFQLQLHANLGEYMHMLGRDKHKLDADA